MIASMQEIYQADMKQGYGGYGKDVIGPYFSVARNSQCNAAAWLDFPYLAPFCPALYVIRI